MGREAELALETEAEVGAAGVCPWPDSCADAFWDLFIRVERAGEEQKHFSGEDSVALWLVGNAEDNGEEADVDGYVQILWGFSGPLRSASILPFQEKEEKLGGMGGSFAGLGVLVCSWESVG